MIAAQSLIKHTAKLRYVDHAGQEHVEHHAAWTACRATEMAWKRARSVMLSGEATAFRIEHSERVFADGEVALSADPFAIPECRPMAGAVA